MGRDAVHHGLSLVDTGSKLCEIENIDLTVVASNHQLAAVRSEHAR